MNNKVIAIIAVVIIAVAGCSAGVILLNDDDTEYRSSDVTGRLAILGNANNDDYIDNKDLSTIDAIIDGALDNEDYPLADADNNGKIDSNDRKIIERMIKREPMTIKYINGNGEVKNVGYPLNRVVVVGSNATMTLQALGAISSKKVVGVTGESTKDYYLFSDLVDIPKVSTSVLAADFDAVTNIGNVDAIITMSSASYLKNEATFIGANIDVVRISSSDGLEAVSVALTMGYLLGLEDRANEYAKFCDEILSHIENKASSISHKDKVTCLTATMTNYVSGSSSDYYTLTTICGGDNIADWTEVTKRFNKGDEWLLKPAYHADKFIHYKQYSYDPDEDQSKMYKTYRSYFEDTQIVKDGNYVLINSNAPAIVRLAYTASVLYPEIYGSDYGDKVHQEYVDKFLDNLSAENYKVTSMKFVLTDDLFDI